MAYEYDLIVIGMGPAGMAVSAMGSAMGLHISLQVARCDTISVRMVP
jgi:pyruvate/2-oxoglutarate dehydrogenase complex dihydrolipoamide dehydrogenase (E3) component